MVNPLGASDTLTPDLGMTTDQLNPLGPQPVVEALYAGDQQPGVALVGVTGDQVGEGLAVAADRCPHAATGFGLPLGRTA
jgi:hypothetical protein